MPEIPTRDSLGRRPVPRSSRSVQGYNAGQEAEAYADSGRQMQDVGGQLEVMAKTRADAKSKLELARAQSYVLQGTTELETNIKMDPDYANHLNKWNEGMAKIKANALNLVQGDQKELFGLAVDDIGVKGTQNVRLNMFDKQSEEFRGKIIENDDATTRGLANALANGDQGKAAALLETQANMYKAGMDTLAIPRDSGPKAAKEAQQRALSDAIDATPPAQRVKLLAPKASLSEAPTVSPTDIINVTMEVEGGNLADGGYVHTDGASANPAIYGINKGAYPKQFDEALKIRDTQGVEAGREYARKFYKEEFYDKRDIGKYKPDVQQVLFDGTFNHYPGFGDKLVAAADKGATAKELIAMRHEEYQRLGKKPKHAPDLQGWMNRLSKVEQAVGAGRRTGGIADILPPDVLAKKLDDASIEEVYSEIDTNPAQALKKLEEGALGQYLDPSKVATLKEQAGSALVKAYDKEELKRLSTEAVNDTENYNKFIAGEMTLADVGKMEAAGGETALTRMARDKLTKDLPEQPADKRAMEFVRLQNKIEEIRVKSGGRVGKKDDFKSGVNSIKEYRKFQEEVLKAAQDRLISDAEAADFLGKFSIPVLKSISEGVSDDRGTFMWGVQDPYGMAFKSFNSYLKNNNRKNDLAAKKELTMRFSDFLGDYQSTGNTQQDELKVNQAIALATASFVKDEVPVLKTLSGTPNSVLTGDGQKKSVAGGKSDLKPDSKVTLPDIPQALSFDSLADAEAANLKPGTMIIVNGRRAMVK